MRERGRQVHRLDCDDAATQLAASKSGELVCDSFVGKRVGRRCKDVDMVKLVENDYEWIPASDGEVPPGAFVGGEDHNGDLFIGRVDHNNDLLPGKINQAYKYCYIAWGGMEHAKSKYQVLCGNGLEWVPSSGSNIPAGAVPGGFSKGEVLYIGRAPHMGTLPIGRVQPSHGVCYVSYGGNEFNYPDYEILVHKST